MPGACQVSEELPSRPVTPAHIGQHSTQATTMRCQAQEQAKASASRNARILMPKSYGTMPGLPAAFKRPPFPSPAEPVSQPLPPLDILASGADSTPCYGHDWLPES